MNNNYTLYAHINNDNGKKYIGITSASPTHRWGKDGAGYQTQPYFYRAIQKHGWDNFTHLILKENLSEEDACELEKLLIATLNTQDKDYGYNYEAGGKHQSEETRKRIAESESGVNHHYYGKHRDEETRLKISESLTGENHYWYGKHLPEDTKKKLSERKKGIRPYNHKREGSTIPLMCLETGEVYDSIS